MRLITNPSLSKYVFAIVLFTLVTVSGIGMFSIFGVDNPNMLTGKFVEFNESMDQLGAVTAGVGDLNTGITDSEPDFGLFGVLNSLISSAWQTLTFIGRSLGFMNEAYGVLTIVFGVPAWIPALVGLLVITLIVFTIFSAIFQTEL